MLAITWILSISPKECFCWQTAFMILCFPEIAGNIDISWAEDLIAGGVEELIHIGFAGGLQTDLKPGDIVLTDGAYNDTAKTVWI